MSTFSISDKAGFASAATTTFHISGKVSFYSTDWCGFYWVYEENHIKMKYCIYIANEMFFNRDFAIKLTDRLKRV